MLARSIEEDPYSRNHDVITADGRVAHIASFRGAGAFLDGYLTPDQDCWRDGDYMRFCMGTISISRRRADLTLVYATIFRRLKDAGADGCTSSLNSGSSSRVQFDHLTDKPEKAYSVSHHSRGARRTTAPCGRRAVPGGAARGECTCAR
jgi:hypothetical protein